MTRATSLKGNTLLGQARGRYILIYTYFFLTFTNVQVLGYKVLSFFFFFFFFFPSPPPPPPNMDLPFPFISRHKPSQSYTWRAEIAFLGLLSHQEHTSKLLPCNLSCATTVHGHFLINAARGVVVLYLMQRGWLLHPSFFIILVFRSKFAFFPF